MEQLSIRQAQQTDGKELDSLYPKAFPEENLLPLINDLVTGEWPITSLVAITDKKIVGHIVLTHCSIRQANKAVALLGPVAVDPAHQNMGIGQTLVWHGFDYLKQNDICSVFVLGDPAYYSRFGFVPESSIQPPYELPKEWLGAWQSVPLLDDAPPLYGELILPKPWLRPKLWAP